MRLQRPREAGALRWRDARAGMRAVSSRVSAACQTSRHAVIAALAFGTSCGRGAGRSCGFCKGAAAREAVERQGELHGAPRRCARAHFDVPAPTDTRRQTLTPGKAATAVLLLSVTSRVMQP